MLDNKYYILPYNWWPGFNEKTDANHIGFFENILSRTKLRNFEILDIFHYNELFRRQLTDNKYRKCIS